MRTAYLRNNKNTSHNFEELFQNRNSSFFCFMYILHIQLPTIFLMALVLQ